MLFESYVIDIDARVYMEAIAGMVGLVITARVC